MSLKRNTSLITGILLSFLTAELTAVECVGQPGEKGLAAHWRFDEGTGKVANDTKSKQADSIQYVFNKARFKPSTDPLWRPGGVVGSALLFDGYSTWIARPAADFASPSDALTISVWVAPRFFEHGLGEKLSAVVNQHDKEKKEGFILGFYRHGAISFQFGTGQHWVELWDEGHPAEKNKWSHLVATYDRKAARAALYLNGKRISEKLLPKQVAGAPIASASTDLVIGKHNQNEKLAKVFDMNMFNGLVDELKIYNRAMSAAEVKKTFQQYLKPHGNRIPEIKPEEIQLDESMFAGDRHRPRFHAIAPAHWMNEPHAPIYYKGKYHLFYQQNPVGPYWGQIHWGHWVSDDMVHWKSLPPALSPENDTLSPDGIWSGSASYDQQGVPSLFFTAANDKASPNQRVALAKPKNINDPVLTEWVKHPQPLIVQEKDIGLFGDFRDPFVWRDEADKKWYLLNGSGLPENGGTALLYSSDNMMDWEYHGPFHTFDYKQNAFLGPVWELPVFLPIGKYPDGEKKYVFLVSPVGKGADVEVFYWLGRFDKKNHRFAPDQTEPQRIDLGDFHFTGPSGLVDPKTGRVIIFTIAQGNRNSQDEYDAGWAHNAGLPVSLSLNEEDRLLVQPIEELKSLRKKELVSFSNKSLAEANKLMEGVKGPMLEIVLEINPQQAQKYGIKVGRSAGGEEETLLYYDKEKKSLFADRTKTSLARNYGVEGGKLDLGKENLKLHIYLDHSMFETYANDYKSLTTRIYPTLADALGLKIWADGEILIENMQVWELKPIQEHGNKGQAGL